MSTSQITCPKCGEPIDIDKLVKHDIERQLRDEFEHKAAHDAELATAQRKDELRKLKELEIKHLELERAHREQKEDIELDIKKRVLEEQQRVEERIKRQENERFTLERQVEAERYLAERKQEAERNLSERKLDAERNLTERKLDSERYEIEKRELQKKYDDQLRLAEEMRRKAEQGSQQMQGEILELIIEEFLRTTFPHDDIQPVVKGRTGADCLHVVNDAGRKVGSIYYESKNTKHFSEEWIGKLKQDMRACGADLGVLVTDVMPKNMERFGNVQGVWVCRVDEFKALCHVLRAMVVNVSIATSSQENKGEKMAMLYQYLTGNEFRMQMEAIVDSFTTMRSELDRERLQTEKNWKQREKQLDKVLVNTAHLYGSIKGIAGSEIATVRQLEPPDDETREPFTLRP
ncbi:MAG: DUF2130 domain-containing protein [bacterium]|nr:DUF2130 domain-containing protein [bacterium]